MFYVLCLLGLVVISSSVRIEFTWRKRNRDDYLCYSIRAIFGLVTVRREVLGIAEHDTRTTFAAANLTHLSTHFIQCAMQTNGLVRWTERIAKRTMCERFMWHSHLGMGNAPTTALASGVYWMLKSTLQLFIQGRLKHFEQPDIMIVPMFSQWHFETYVHCVASIRLYRALLSLCEFVMLLSRHPRRGANWLSLFQSVRTLMKKPSVRSNRTGRGDA